MATSTDLLPGQRLVAGKPYTFNMDMLLAHKAREAVRSAPDGFEGWGDVQLNALRYDCLTFVISRRPCDLDIYDEASRVLARVEAERTRRVGGKALAKPVAA